MGGWFGYDTDAGFNGIEGGAHGISCSTPSTLPPPTITPTTFLAYFANDSNMNAQSTDAIQAKITQSTPNFNVGMWGDKYNLGQFYYVAHQLMMDTIASKSPIVDTVTSKRAGGVSKSASADLIRQQNTNPFLRTIYGQQYLDLRRSLSGGIAAV
jgi:hypothetical protein